MPQRHKVTKFHEEELTEDLSFVNSLSFSDFLANIFREYNLKIA
jgi:hypothetical protein